jgi:hypothetical protein
MAGGLTQRVVEEGNGCGLVSAKPAATIAMAEPLRARAATGDKLAPAATAIAICIPFGHRDANGSLRWIPPEFTIALATLEVPPGSKCLHLFTKGIKRDLARNQLAHQALAQGARYIMFLDDDNPPPPDALVKLKEVLDSAGDEFALVGGIYCDRFERSPPLVFQRARAGPYWRWRVGEVFECPGGIATGCMMIRANVFEHLPQPWFKDLTTLDEAHASGWFLDRQMGSPAGVPDDMYFCGLVREAGFRMLAHGGVLPAHWGQDGKCYRLRYDTYPFRGKAGEES